MNISTWRWSMNTHTVMTMDTMIMCMNKCRRVNTATPIATSRGAIRIRTCRTHIIYTATNRHRSSVRFGSKAVLVYR